MSATSLIGKSIKTLKQEGLRSLVHKTKRYIYKKQDMYNNMNKLNYYDVLFINGCNECVPHPHRYRVTHQREQLMANGIFTDEVYYMDLELDSVPRYRCFIFFRCPVTDTIREFIKIAKNKNKTCLFDIDDLVIDTSYTDLNDYVKRLEEKEKILYDDGVVRMGETLKLCDGAITTTKRLALELEKFIPEVFINRNTASEEMVKLSEVAWRSKKKDNCLRIGYFSGSITHNEDFVVVKEVIIALLNKYPYLRLCLVGELELPKEFETVKHQVEVTPFVDWKHLPTLIAAVDINIAPLTNNIFNEAKSENKWVEAALVKVPSVMSNIGAFKEMVESGVNGVLCNNKQEWYEKLEQLILSPKMREEIADSAYKYCLQNCITLYSGYNLAEYIKSMYKENIAFVLPSLEISGGILVALRHAVLSLEAGKDVYIVNTGITSQNNINFMGYKFPVIYPEHNNIYMGIDKAVATMWVTLEYVEKNSNIKNRYYLVQGLETEFYPPGAHLRIMASQTYNKDNINYVTISNWCKKWLKDIYNKDSKYVLNGIDTQKFFPVNRCFSNKIKLLIEGDSEAEYKNIDESFKIVNYLKDRIKDRFEVYYVSYNGKAKNWYKVDKFFHKVKYGDMPDLYRECHILLKSSILESFSYPPLEMMSTGGLCVVRKNEGNTEYLIDGQNCLFYDPENLQTAVENIIRLTIELDLRENLIKNGIKTAQKRDWSVIKNDIIKVYN